MPDGGLRVDIRIKSKTVLPVLRLHVAKSGLDQLCTLTQADEQDSDVVLCASDQSKLWDAPVRLGEILDYIFRLQQDFYQSDFTIGPYMFQPKKLQLCMHDNGDVVKLTDKEKEILIQLAYAPEQTMEREALLNAVWGFGDGIETHTAETHIYRLRQKIEKDASNPAILTTTKQGYKLVM